MAERLGVAKEPPRPSGRGISGAGALALDADQAAGRIPGGTNDEPDKRNSGSLLAPLFRLAQLGRIPAGCCRPPHVVRPMFAVGGFSGLAWQNLDSP